MEFQPFFCLFEVNGILRAKFFAGPALPLLKVDTTVPVNGILQRDCLSVIHINRLAFRQILIKRIFNLLGTLLSAGATSDALLHLHIAGVFEDLYFKAPHLAINCVHFGQGEKLNVQMPVDLNQFRGYDSHSTIVCGKRFVQLSHCPAYGRAFF
jgi:hypothetical protein